MPTRITSDISRQLKSEVFEQGSTMTFDIPRDTVLKHLQLRLKGSVTVTYASGSPVSDDTSTLDRLVNFIDVTASGSFTIKNITPWMLHMQNLMASSNFGVRRSSAGASSVDFPSQDGKFDIGTTGQVTSVVESVLVSFENVMAGKGRSSTMWDTRGLSSAVLKISTATLDNILEAGSDPADFSFASGDPLQFQIETIEVQDVPQNASFSTWKQTTQVVSFSAQTNEFRQPVNRGNFLQGFMFEVRNGDARRSLSNVAVGDLRLIINGSRYIQNTTFQQLQDKNRNRYGLNASYSNDQSLLDGIAYMDLLTPTSEGKFGSLGTAQDATAPNVDEVQLGITTRANADYSAGPVQVKIMTNELIRAVE